MYYKIIKDNAFIGIATEDDFARYQQKHSTLIYCDINIAEYLVLDGDLYRDAWLKPEVHELAHEDASIIAITEEEYSAIKETIEDGEEVSVDVLENDNNDDPENEDTDDGTYGAGADVTLEYVKQKKISALSKACAKTIKDGFDVILSDGETYHFNLETEDQMRISQLYEMAEAGCEFLPYHASGEQTVNYPAEDIETIKEEMDRTVIYHTAYFGSLREYVNSLESVDDVSNIIYGASVPEAYQSEVLKDIKADQSVIAEAFNAPQERITEIEQNGEEISESVTDLEDAIVELAEMVGGE